MLRDSIQNLKRDSSERTKYERIKNLLLVSGKINFSLSLNSVYNRPYNQGEPLDLLNTKLVIFETNEKKYSAIISSDYNSLINIEEMGTVDNIDINEKVNTSNAKAAKEIKKRTDKKK